MNENAGSIQGLQMRSKPSEGIGKKPKRAAFFFCGQVLMDGLASTIDTPVLASAEKDHAIMHPLCQVLKLLTSSRRAPGQIC
jgi:hypothetical protein